MHSISRPKTNTLHQIAAPIVHGSAPVIVGERPAAVPFERSSVGHKQRIAIDPEKTLNATRNMHTNGRRDCYSPFSGPLYICLMRPGPPDHVTNRFALYSLACSLKIESHWVGSPPTTDRFFSPPTRRAITSFVKTFSSQNKRGIPSRTLSMRLCSNTNSDRRRCGRGMVPTRYSSEYRQKGS